LCLRGLAYLGCRGVDSWLVRSAALGGLAGIWLVTRPV